METVSAVVILLILLISASITLVVVLTAVPIEDNGGLKHSGHFRALPTSSSSLDLRTNAGEKSTKPFIVNRINDSARIINDDNNENVMNDSQILAKSIQDNQDLEDLPFRMIDFETLVNGVPNKDTYVKIEQQNSAETSKDELLSLYGSALQKTYASTTEDKDNVTMKSMTQDELIIPEQQLNLLYRVPFSTIRIVGIAYHKNHLYIGTSKCQIHVLSAETGHQVQEISLGESIEGMTISGRGNIVTLHHTQIRSFNGAKNVYELELGIPGNFITTDGNKIIVLSKSAAQIYILTETLEIVKQINMPTSGLNACNFIAAADRSLFISCEKAIRQVSMDGQLKGEVGAAENITYSLGVGLDDKHRLLAVLQGQPRIRVFLDGRPVEDLYSGKVPSIWSAILYENRRLHVIDYISNTLLTFQYPEHLL
uniref:CNH domain-containing protein n=1 Tax=Syphacia muris TaxID=451379 RepID=A0A0N5ASX8_9BILA